MKWLLAILALLAAAVLLQLAFLAYAMYALLAVGLLSRFLVREWSDHISGTRRTSTSGEPHQIGEQIVVTATVKNNGPFRIPWLLIEDGLPADALTQNPPRLKAGPGRLALAQLKSGQEQTLQYRIELLMRGYYQVGPLLVENGDLFGLHRRYRILTEPEFILVLPKVVPLQGYDLESRRNIGEIRMSHRLFEDPTRICGIRAYQNGDALNRIHWRASARTGHFQSKVYEPSSVAGATILLDFHQASHQGRGQPYRTELAVTAAASLTNALTQMGQRVGLITNGRDAADRIREEGWSHEFLNRAAAKAHIQMRGRSDRLRPVIVQTQRGPEQLSRILETLARLELTDGFEFPELIAETSSHIPRNASVIAVFTEIAPESAMALSHLQRQGYAVTVVLVVFDRAQTHDWAQRPEWAAWLLSSGIELRQVQDEADLQQLCSTQLLR